MLSGVWCEFNHILLLNILKYVITLPYCFYSVWCCGLEIMCRLIRLATHRLWLSYSNLEIGRVATRKRSACSSQIWQLQTRQLQTRKSHANILESLQIRSCVNGIGKLLYGSCWFHKPKFKLSTQIQYTSYFIQVWSREFFRQEISN